MKNTGLVEILESSFGSVQKIMKRKFFPQNLRALWLLADELLKNILPDCTSSDDL